MFMENTTASAANDSILNKKPLNCSSPAEIFSIATALTLLFAKEFNQTQLNTLINLLGLLQSGLSAIVTQMEICDGEVVQPPIE